MNKYHKCIQELGRTLSGWGKVGAVALGVGVGTGAVHVPGGGQYAKAGKYKVQIKSREPVEGEPSGYWVDFEVMDENTGEMGSCRWFVEQRNRAVSVAKSKGLNRVKGKFCLRSYCDFQLEVGGVSFAQLSKFGNRLSVKGGTKSDILHITSDRETFVPKDEVLQARELVVEDTLFNVEGGLDCCTVCFLRLKKPSHISRGGALMCDVLACFDAYFGIEGAVKCNSIVVDGGCFCGWAESTEITSGSGGSGMGFPLNLESVAGDAFKFQDILDRCSWGKELKYCNKDEHYSNAVAYGCSFQKASKYRVILVLPEALQQIPFFAISGENDERCLAFSPFSEGGKSSHAVSLLEFETKKENERLVFVFLGDGVTDCGGLEAFASIG